MSPHSMLNASRITPVTGGSVTIGLQGAASVGEQRHFERTDPRKQNPGDEAKSDR